MTNRIRMFVGLVSLLATVLEAPSAMARIPGWDDPAPKAAGILFGEPTGLSGKLWIDDRRALDAGLAYSFDDWFMIYGDYLWHFPRLIGRSSPWAKQILPYAGLGGLLYLSTVGDRSSRLSDDRSTLGLAIRIPVGVEWRPVDTRLGVFLELTPGVGIIPSTFGMLQGGLGVRYYFE